MKILNIFSYNDYKIFVQDWVKNHESGGRGLYKKMADHLRLSHVMISQIMNSEKHLSSEHAFSLAQFLHLSGVQRDFFLALVSYARAGTHEYQTYWKEQINTLRAESQDLKKRMPQDRQLSETEKARFYSHWVYSASRLATSIPNLRTPEKIAERFQLSVEMVQEVIEFLIQLGLVVEGPKGLDMGPQRIHLDKNSPFIHSRQIGWRFKAIQQMNSKKSEDLFYTGPMSISKSAQKDFHEQFLKLFEQISARVTEEEPETLVCLNLDFFEF
jgi:uncharacterized protein (TIGR02147 family)